MASIRLIIVGTGSVGKTALTVRYTSGKFVERYDPTIEDTYRKQVEWDKHSYLLDLMDTAGQDEYSSLRDMFMQNADGFMLVYAINSFSSWKALEPLRTQAMRVKDAAEGAGLPMLLVGNKSDLNVERSVMPEEAAEQAKRWKCGCIEMSAASGHNVHEAFQELIRRVVVWRVMHPESPATSKHRKQCALC